MTNYSLFGYALASSLILIFCWIIYRILFETKVKPSLNRIILLAIYGFALLIPFVSPLIQFSHSESNIVIGMLSLVDIHDQHSEITVQESESLQVLPLLAKIYLLGLGVMIIITGTSIYKL